MIELPLMAYLPRPRNPPWALSACRTFLAAAETDFVPFRLPFYLPVLITSLSTGFWANARKKVVSPDWTTLRLPSRLPWIEPAEKWIESGCFVVLMYWIYSEISSIFVDLLKLWEIQLTELAFDSSSSASSSSSSEERSAFASAPRPPIRCVE